MSWVAHQRNAHDLSVAVWGQTKLIQLITHATKNNMEIVNVSYGITRNTGNYQNIKLAAEATVNTAENESPKECLKNLIDWVESRANDLVAQGKELEIYEQHLTRLNSKIYYAEMALKSMEGVWDKAAEDWNELLTILEKAGVKTESYKEISPSKPDFSAKKVSINENLLLDEDEEDEDETEGDF